jgi:pseudaminic acid biosynthesis-associated methylase
MPTVPAPKPEQERQAERLEALWKGDFGDSYTERNALASEGRLPFWSEILASFPASRILEVGCNLGANVRCIATLVAPRDVYGIEINESALRTLRTSHPDINAVWGRARELPFQDGFFDLVFTCGVLIHQPPDSLLEVMSEIVRCSRRYVLCAEYFAETLTEVPYRGQTGALYKMDFGGIYQQHFQSLKLLRKGFLSKAEGWDDVSFWVFEKQA